MFLALVMVVGMLPVNALATETGEQIVEETQAAAPVAQTELTEDPIEESTEAPVEESTEAPTEEPTEAPTEEPTEAPTEPVVETTAATEAPVEETEPEQETIPVETVAGNASVPEMDAAVEETTEATEPEETVTVQVGNVVPSVSGLPSDEELFAGYATGVLYGNDAAVLGTAAYDALADGSNEKIAYEALKPILQEIAAGERSSAIITVGTDMDPEKQPDVAAVFDGSGLNQDFLDNVMNALLADMPYELYWFDKVSGMSYGVTTYTITHEDGTKSYEYLVTFYFCVAGNYNDGTSVTLNYSDGSSAKLYCGANKGITGAAAAAAAVAETVATDNVYGKSDYEKLVYFKDYICGKVSYDHTAASTGDFSEDDDPWQLIHVFDTDSTTNVVCEGYSKAFQYLCDLATFENKTIRCYSVTGSLVEGTDAEPHMWNIVTIDGSSYMVDVTNTDEASEAGMESFGEDGCLFLTGASGSIANGYVFTNHNGYTIKFIYTYTDSNGVTDTTSTDTWGSGATSILNLSETGYEPSAGDGGDIETGDDLLNITVNSEAALRSAIDAGYSIITLKDANITLTSDLLLPHASNPDIPQAQKLILDDATLTVPAGRTLTLNSRLNIQGGTLTVNGTLVNNVYEDGDPSTDDIGIWCEEGALTVNGTYENTNGGLIIVTSNYGFSVGGTNLIPNSSINRNTYVYSEAELLDLLDTADDFAHNQMCIYEDISLSKSIVIPGNADLVVDGYEGGKLTVPTDMTLTNNGLIDVIGDSEYVAEVMVKDDGTLINNKLINVEEGCALHVAEGGTFTNNGEITGNGTYPGSDGTEEPVQNDLDELQTAIDAAAQAGETEYWINEDVTLYGELTMSDGFNLYTGSDVTITVPAGETLDLPGMTMNGGTLNVDGTLNVNGALFMNNGAYVWVNQDAVLNLYGAMHVGFYKDASHSGYAGVLDIGGILNIIGGYLNVCEDGTNAGGILNVYNTMNVKPNGDGWGGFLDVGGTVWLADYSETNVTINGLNNGGVAVNSCGFFGYSREEGACENRNAEINVDDKAVSMVVNRGATVEGIENSKMIGIYLADDGFELTDVMADAQDDGYAMVQVESTSRSFFLPEDMTVPEGTMLKLRCYEESDAPVLTIPSGVTLTIDGEMDINPGAMLDLKFDSRLVNNGTIYNGGFIRYMDSRSISGEGEIRDNQPSMVALTLEELQARIDEAAANGENEYWLNEDAVLYGTLELPEGFGLFTSMDGITITIPTGQTLFLNARDGASISLNDADLNVEGTLNINGPLFVNNGSYFFVGDEGVVNVNHSLQVGIHKNDDVEDYAGVVDVCGTMNVCGYLFVEGTGLNGGVLNIYNTLNLVKDTTVDYDRYGLLEISGEVVVGAYGVLDLSEVTLIGNGGISINHGGSFVLDETPAEAGEYHKGVITGLTPGVVSMSGYNSEQVDIDKSYIIGDFYGGSNSGELAAALTDAANAGETYYGVQVKLWDTTITLDRDITVPEGVTLILNNNGDGYYEELLIPDGRKLINNGTIILNEETCLRVLEGAELENNGEIIINQWAAMYKYGTLSGEGSISGDGDYAEGIMTHADLMAELEKINNDDSNVGSWIHESITTLDPAVNGGVLDISMGIRASDNLVRRFRFTDYGKIIVPNGCTLIISSPTILMGGQILVEAGGKLVINNTLNVGLGTVYVANGGEVDWNADVTGRITFQDDIPDNHLSTYWVHNYGEGWFENYAEYWPNYDFRMVPGEEHFWIFYTNVWDAENLKWIRTPVPVNNLRGSNNLTVFPMSDLDWDEADKAARAGEANADCFAVVRINDDARWGSTGKVTAEGLTYNITIDRDYNGGFYSAPEATNENWLINYQYNKFRNEDSFYFIFTNEDVTVKEVKAEDESLASVVPYDDSGRIFKITLNKDALQLDEQINNYHGFDVNLDVVVTNPSNGEENWDFGLYCEPLVWNTPEGDLSHADLMAALDAQKNVNNWAAGWIQDAVTVLDPGTNGGVLDISMGTRESDGLTRYFAVVDGGEIIVPSGCELIITNPTRLQGGKITVENGGTLTVNGTLNVGTGTVYMASGATINWGDNNMLLGEITFESSSKDSYLSAFWLREWGEGWFESCKYEDSIRDFRFTPGQEFHLIFYSNVWNETEAKWERTPIKPSSLSYDKTLLEILEWNYEDFPVQEGEANSDCFVLVRPNGDVWDKDIQIQYNGMSFNVHIGRDLNMGFYSAPEATNENWLTNYAFNGYRAEDSFYYIFTKEVEGVTYTVNDVTLWDDCKQYADIAKYSDNIYKITLKDEYRNNYDMSFGINVDAHLTITSGSSSTNTNWGFGEIRCLPLTWNGNVGNPTPHEDLLVILEHLHDWSGGWVQETTTTLKKDFNNGKLDTAVMGIRESDNRTRELFLFEGGEIIVSDGCTLTIHNPVYVRGGKITVKPGGTLHVNGLLEITQGGVFVEEGGTVTYGDNAEVKGQIMDVEAVPQPYLVGRELHNDEDGTGWYESFDEPLSTEYVQGVRTCSSYYVIFYLNEWDAEKQEWVATPVVPTTSNGDLYGVKKLTEDENEQIREGQPNAEYFVRLEGYGDLHHADTTITVKRDGQEDLVFDYNVWGRTLSFYTAPEAAVENLIWGWNVNLDPEKENVFYAIVNETDWFEVYDWNIRVNTWGDDYNAFVPEGEQFLYIEELTDESGAYTGVCKFTVNPAYAEYMQYDWRNFNIEVTAFTKDMEGSYGSLTEDLWISPPEQMKEHQAYIEVNDEGYLVFDGMIIKTVPTGEYDPNGNEIWDWSPSALPEGVSYDFTKNILTLEDAHLSKLWMGVEELPNENLTIQLIGDENEIINEDSSAVHLAHGMNATISGDGSLYVKGTNVDAFNLDDGSSLTIAGSAKLTVEIAGDSSRQTALWGCGGNLTVCENATLTTVVPENAVRFGEDLTDYGIETYGINGFTHFWVNDNAIVNTQFYHVPNEGSFNLISGTVNIEGLDGVWTDGTKIEYTNEGIFTECGKINIHGGTLNIDAMPNPAEGCTSYFHGISTDYGTVSISGGTVNINSNSHRGMGIKIAAKYNEDGTLSDTVGGYLEISGGNLYFNRENPNDHPLALRVYDQSKADIYGDVTFHVAGQSFVLNGESTWCDAVFEGDGASFIANRLAMESGTIHMVNDGYVAFGKENYMSGGTIDLDNSYMEVEGYINIMNGARVDIDMDIDEVATGEGVENGGYDDFVLRINGKMDVMDDANITIDINIDEEFHWDARMNGIQVYGVYEQMGGEVTVNNSNPTCSTFVSFGQTYLRDGILNLNGGRTGMVQAFNNDPDDPEEEWSILQVHGGELNIIGEPDGILVEGPTEFYGGRINITAENAAIDRDPSAIAVMTTGENSHSYLAIFGGTINLSAYELDDAVGEDALEGIGLYAYGAPINIYGGSVEMDADVAMRIDGDIYMDGEGITFVDAEGNPLTLPADGDSHILSYADGTVAKTAVIGVSRTLADFLANTEPDENGRYKVDVNVYVDESMTLENKIVDIMPGASLTVKNNAVLTIDENSHLVTMGGSIAVENGSMIDNYGILANDGGSIIVNGATGYGHHGDMNTHYHSAVLNNTVGIATENQRLIGDVENTEQFNTILALAEDYGYVEIWTASGMELNGTIPKNVKLAVDGQESTAVLNVTEGLTVDGDLALGNVILNVAEGATLTNNGSITTDIHDRAVLNIAGYLVSNSGSEFNLNKSTVIVDGTLENRTGMFINDGSVMTVNGTLNNYDCLHVGHWKMTQEEIAELTRNGHTGLEFSETAGILSINGTMNNYYYINTGAHTESSGGIINVSGKLNILMDESEYICGHIDHSGQLNVLGEMVVESMTSVMAFVNSSIKVSSTGTLTNNGGFGFATELNGDEADDGSRGILVIDGTFINNNRVAIDTRAVATVNGTLINHTELTVQGLVEVEGAATNNGTIYVEDSGVLDIKPNGSFTNNGDVIYRGTCGDELSWSVKGGILTISGSGAMMNYENAVDAPWNGLADQITKIKIGVNVTSLGTHAFETCTKVTSVVIPRNCEAFYSNTFAYDADLDKYTVELNVYHESTAERLAQEIGIGYTYIHEIVDGECIYGDYSLNDVLTDTNTSVEEKAEELKKTDNESLKTEMENNSDVVDQIEQLEQEILNSEDTDLTVDAEVEAGTSEAVTTVFGNVSSDAIVGAVVNAAETATEVKLVIGDSSEEFVDENDYNTENGVVFSMTLEGVEDASNLDVPVKITLPVPEGIDTSKLKVLHYHDGEVSEVNYTLSADGKEVSFILTGFSDFAMVEQAEAEPEIEKINLSGTAMTLGNTLSMDFGINVAKLENNGEGHYAIITKHYADGREDVQERVDRADWKKYSGTVLTASFADISAKEMCDEVEVVVYNADGVAVSNPYSDSVKSFAMRTLNNSNNQSKMELLTTVVDMLNYGAAAQQVFGYDASNLANADMTEAQKAMATQNIAPEDGRVKGPGYAGSTLTLKSEILLDFVFYDSVIGTDYTGMYAIATYTDHYGNAEEVRMDEFKKYANGYHYVSVTGMAVADCCQLVTCTVYDADGNAIASASDSVEGYIARSLANGTTDAIYAAVMKFSTSAYNYFH